jgi:hypothetical protein
MVLRCDSKSARTAPFAPAHPLQACFGGRGPQTRGKVRLARNLPHVCGFTALKSTTCRGAVGRRFHTARQRSVGAPVGIRRLTGIVATPRNAAGRAAITEAAMIDRFTELFHYSRFGERIAFARFGESIGKSVGESVVQRLAAWAPAQSTIRPVRSDILSAGQSVVQAAQVQDSLGMQG